MKIRIALFIAILFLPSYALAAEVVASIRPIHSLVAMVMGDVGSPVLLSGVSPHTASLKPSERQLIAEARKVFIISPDFERYLSKALKGHQGAVALAETKGITLLDFRHEEEEEHEEHDEHAHEEEHHDHDEHHDEHEHEEHAHKEEHHDDHDEHHDDHHGHHHGDTDYHIWLDPRNAEILLDRIAEELAEIYPQHRATFFANAKANQVKLHALDAEIASILAPHRDKHYVVFHDAYQYFEERYDIEVIASIIENHEAPISAARLASVKHMIEDERVSCVFAEPQFDPRLAALLSEDTNIGFSVIDPLGAALPIGENLYENLLRLMANSIANC